tara:strand:- start:48 stop:575 length:528 start_codon:yes stop_codon:yes gene_type:complete
MGLLITGSVTNHSGEQFDHFYARIDHYQLQKSLGHVCTTLGFYESKETAENMFPAYQEDYLGNDASGNLGKTSKDGEVIQSYIEFPLTSSEQVTVTSYSSSLEDRMVDYIDYDDDGNEVTKQRTQAIEVITTGSEEVTKSRIRMDLITGSLGEYTYDRLKTHFGEIFGSSNIKDL